MNNKKNKYLYKIKQTSDKTKIHIYNQKLLKYGSSDYIASIIKRFNDNNIKVEINNHILDLYSSYLFMGEELLSKIIFADFITPFSEKNETKFL